MTLTLTLQMFISLVQLVLFFLVCNVSTPPAVRSTLFATDGYGIFNVRKNVGACRRSLTCATMWVPAVHTKRGQAAHELTRRDRTNRYVTLAAPPGDRKQGLRISIATPESLTYGPRL